jgi:rod shape determining protein RodA
LEHPAVAHRDRLRWLGRARLGQGTQATLDFLPEYTTDFAFSVLAEEFGWIGVATVFALYLFVVGRCLWIAVHARDTHARLLAGSLGLAFFVYVLVNGGMISGLLPVVGIPMPLISYGGTSAVSLLAGIGLVMAVRGHRPVHGDRVSSQRRGPSWVVARKAEAAGGPVGLGARGTP